MAFSNVSLKAACGMTKPFNPRRPGDVLIQVEASLDLSRCSVPAQLQAVDKTLTCLTYTSNIIGEGVLLPAMTYHPCLELLAAPP